MFKMWERNFLYICFQNGSLYIYIYIYIYCLDGFSGLSNILFSTVISILSEHKR